jgi:receptor protein-tyrosine kinase
MSSSTITRPSFGSRFLSPSDVGSEVPSWRRPDNLPTEPAADPEHPWPATLDSSDPRREKIRALRTELLLRRESIDRADIVALLSPCAGDGRSLMAAELAIAFGQTGHSTLLVDADFRFPHQHVLFATSNSQGLAQALEYNEKPLLHTLKSLPKLSFLPAGEALADPLALLSSHRFATLVEEWRDSFDCVVIDTPPIHQFSDGLAVASQVGRVLALSRAQHTSFDDMQDMLRRLAATRCQILGAVISHF